MMNEEKTIRDTMEEVYDSMTEQGEASEEAGQESADGHAYDADHAEVTSTTSDDYTFEESASYASEEEADFSEAPTAQQTQAPEESHPQFEAPNYQDGSHSPDPGVWAPYLQEVGVSADQAFQILLQTEYSLRHGTPEQKRNAILGIMSEYGVDLGSGVPTAQQHAPTPLRDPAVSYLEQQFGMLLQHLQHQQRGAATNDTLRARAQIAEFKSQTKNGKLLHPHYDAVEMEMTSLMATGRARTLGEAYNMAIHANPRTRDLLSEDRRNERRVAAHERAQRAKKAVKASVLPSASPGGPKAPKTMRETMEEVYDRMTS